MFIEEFTHGQGIWETIHNIGGTLIVVVLVGLVGGMFVMMIWGYIKRWMSGS